MNTIRTPFKLPLTAAATALLLAACGGGGGNDTAVSASPDASGTTTANLEVASTPSTGTPSTAAGTEAGNSGSATAAPATPDTPVSTPSVAAAPISANGVRGDVLVSMLDRRSCNYLREAPSLSEPRIRDANGNYGLLVSAYALINPNPYAPHPNPPPGVGPISPTYDRICDPLYRVYQSAPPGTYQLNTSSFIAPRFGAPLRPGERTAFHRLHTETQVTITADRITLDTNLKVAALTNASGQSLRTLSSPQSFSFSTTDQLSYGVLHTWSLGQQSVQLKLLKGNSADQARLCWNSALSTLKREQCLVVQVPADWQRGQALKYVDHTIVDDNSFYDGASGQTYLRASD